MILYLVFSLSVSIIPISACNMVFFFKMILKLTSKLRSLNGSLKKAFTRGLHHLIIFTKQVLKIKYILRSVNMQRCSFFHFFMTSLCCIYVLNILPVTWKCYQIPPHLGIFQFLELRTLLVFGNSFHTGAPTDMTPKVTSSVTFFQNTIFSVTVGAIVCLLYLESHVPSTPFSSSAPSFSPRLGLWSTRLLRSKNFRVREWNIRANARVYYCALCKWILKILNQGNNSFLLFAYLYTIRMAERTSLRRNCYFSLVGRAVNHKSWEKQSLIL